MQEKMWSESEYFSTLEEKNKDAYKKKLTLSSGMLLPDPYVLVNWKNDVSMMPDIHGVTCTIILLTRQVTLHTIQ